MILWEPGSEKTPYTRAQSRAESLL